MRKRFDEVDLLRAFGILGVIIVHILTYHLTSPIYIFFWNYLQFVVVAFVFCSGFVLSSIYQNSLDTISKTLLWYKKRFIRLIFPFWIYLLVHYSLWILFPQFFQGLGLIKTPLYFFQSAIFIGGTNFNWLPLLFLQLTFLFPIFTNLISKNKKILAVYIIFAIIVTAIFTFLTFPYSYYRLAMFIPWSLVLLVAIFVAVQVKKEKPKFSIDKVYLILGIVFFAQFISLYISNLGTGRSLNFYDHKYPPDFYYLFFGLALTCFVLIIARLKFWQNPTLKKVYFYISNNSYQIFFTHYILLDLILTLSRKNAFLQNPVLEFVIILSLSLILTFIFNQRSKILPKKNV